MKNFKSFFALTFLLVILICSSAIARDWVKYPASIELTGVKRVAAVGDVHGAFDQFSNTLEALKVAQKVPGSQFDMEWTGKETLLVLTGDICDRGKYTKELYDLIIKLEKQAPKTGGRVIALLGNHEAMLLNGQVEDWAKNLTSYKKQHYQNTLDSFTNAGLDFHEAISEKGKYGAWIRNRPLFAIVNGFMFAHGGLPRNPTTKSTLVANYIDDVEKGDWKKGIFMDHNGPLWNRKWWKYDDQVTKCLQVLGVHGIVFGHTVGAIAEKGRIAVKDKRIISIDVGMTPTYGNSQGAGLLIETSEIGRMIFRGVYPDQAEELLFQIPMPAAAYPSK